MVQSPHGLRRPDPITLETVFAWATGLIDRSVPPSLQIPLHRLLNEGQQQAAALEVFAPIELSVGVYAAVRGTEEGALPLAVACTLAYLGIDALDDTLDGDYPAGWASEPPGARTLAGVTALASLSYLALVEGAAPATGRAAARVLAAGLAEAAAGQYADLAGQIATTEAAIAIARGKSGGEWAAFAAAAAALAGAPDTTIAEFATFGRDLGTAGQLASDCADLWGDEPSRDLAAGRVTLPIAYALQTADNRAVWFERLQRAQTDPAAQAETAALLQASGALFYAAMVIERYRQEALARLAQLPGAPAGQQRLLRLAEYIRLIPSF